MDKIEARNKRFAQMNTMEARVEICKDVLLHLDQSKLRATAGTYIGLLHPTEKNIRAIPQCNVCALGALFIAAVLKYDELQDEETGYSYRFLITNYLSPFFDNRTLDKIECAFEESNLMCEYSRPVEWMKERLLEAGYSYYEAEEEYLDKIQSRDEFKLRTIMENIIQHNGEFVI